MIYRFGPYTLDDAARELRNDGRLVETEPKAFDLLVYLVSNRDRAVPKDELLNELWPRQIVTETALTRCVMKARRAVGDESATQSVVKTVHGHGYRFVAELLPEPAAHAAPRAADSAPSAEPAGALPPVPARRLHRVPVVTAAVIVLLGLLALLVMTLREPAEARTGLLAVLPVTNRVDDTELGWIRLGLMSLLQRMLEEAGIDSVPERDVLSAIGELSLDAPPDPGTFTSLIERTGAESVLHTTLDTSGGLYRLSTVITHADGRRTRRMIVGDSPAGLAADMAAVLSGVMAGDGVPAGERFRRVSTDAFVNELYARALNLELQGELEEARELFRLAAAEEPELFWLRYEIAVCTRDLREWHEAEAMFEALYEEAESGADARALIVTLNSHGILYLNQNEYARAEPLLERALDVAAERGKPADRATVHINLALINDRLGRAEDARQHYDAALEAFEQADQPTSPFLLNNYAGFLLNHGELESAQAYSEQAIQGFRLRGQPRYEAPSLNRLGRILRRRGDLDGALARHEQALAIYRALGNVPGELSVLTAMTAVYRAKGELTRAANNARDVIERARAEDDPLLLADAYMQAAYVASDRGDADGALAGFEAALAVFEPLNDDAGIRGASLGIALAAIERGEAGRAVSIAASLSSRALAANNAGATAEAQWLEGKIAEATGEPDAAARAYSRALDYARASNDAGMLVDSGTALAGLHLVRGNLPEAALLVEEIRPHAVGQHDFLRLDARLALAVGDVARAANILRDLRARAGEAWTAADDQLLAKAAE